MKPGGCCGGWAGGKPRLEGKKQFINVLMTWDLVTAKEWADSLGKA